MEEKRSILMFNVGQSPDYYHFQPIELHLNFRPRSRVRDTDCPKRNKAILPSNLQIIILILSIAFSAHQSQVAFARSPNSEEESK